MSSSSQPSTCPDLLDLQRWLDGEPTDVDPSALAAHASTCDACRTQVSVLQQGQALVDAALTAEARAAAQTDAAILEAVHARLLKDAVRPAPAESGRWWRLATAATLLAASVAGALWVLGQQPVQASAEWVISESEVRGRSWRTQPGKVRQEVYDLYTQDAGKPAVHQRQVAVFSTIPGDEQTTTHVTDASGTLVNATWRRTDGWGARFDTRNGPHLTLDPSTEDVEALFATLTGDDADAFRYWQSVRLWQVRPQAQAATQASMLGGRETYFMTSIGRLQGEPSFRSDAARHVIAFTVLPHRALPDGALLAIEDTFASGSLVHERRVIRRITPTGALLGESGRRLISRGDADRATLDRLMAEMIAPPAHWRVTRTTPEEALAEARRFWARMRPLLATPEPPATPDAPESQTR